MSDEYERLRAAVAKVPHLAQYGSGYVHKSAYTWDEHTTVGCASLGGACAFDATEQLALAAKVPTGGAK